MRLQEETINSHYSATYHPTQRARVPESDAARKVLDTPAQGDLPAARAPSPTRFFEPTSESLEDWSTPGDQDAQITTMLRQMALGHFCVGVLLVLGSIIMEAALHQPALFGLAASGGMLGASGLITLLTIRHQPAAPSSLAFYLLPYADFAIVGLWLLLFGVSSLVVLFYAYVVVSAAMLLGSRHALVLAGIASATTVAIGLGAYLYQITPAITLPPPGGITLTLCSIVLALGLVAYIARLFSANLDCSMEENAQQSLELAQAHVRTNEQRQHINRELEMLSDTYARFMEGHMDARAMVSNGSLTSAAHMLNALLDQVEQLTHLATLRARAEKRIGELNQAIERLGNGDASAFDTLGSPIGTSLDITALGLARIARQLNQLQQAVQQTRVGTSALLSIASEISLLRQTLSNTLTSVSDLLSRSAQSALHLHVLLESEEPRPEGRRNERPLLQEMELRARQQGAGLEMVYSRLGHMGTQLEAIENEMRHIAESIERLTRLGPFLHTVARADMLVPEHPALLGLPAAPHVSTIPLYPTGAPPPSARSQPRPPSGPLNPLDARGQLRPPSGSLRSAGPLPPLSQGRTPSSPLQPAGLPPDRGQPRPPSGPLNPADGQRSLPRRFTGPLTRPPHMEEEQANYDSVSG